MSRPRMFLLCFALLASLLPFQTALADIGPKPTMEFEFEQEAAGDTLTILSGVLYECDQSDCSDAAPLEPLGPQGLYCEAEGCHAISYGFAEYHRLEIQFSDGKTRQSNIFMTIDFDSIYLVHINADDLSVDEVAGLPAPPFDEPSSTPSSPPPPFPAPNSNPNVSVILGVALCAGLGFILVVGLAVFLMRRSRMK